MKYALILFVGLSMAASGAFAQEKPARDRLAEIEQMTVKPSRHHKPAGEFDKIGINLIPDIGYGDYYISSDDFKSKGSVGVYAHLLEGFVRPVSWFSLHVGGGLGWNRYQSAQSVFSLDDANHIRIRPMSEEELATGNSRSSIVGPTVLIPATLQFRFGDVSLRVGAEAIHAFRTKVRTDFYEGDVRKITITPGAVTVPWSYDFFASVSFDGLGIFVKYQPAAFRQFPQPGPTLSCLALGIRMGI